MNPPWIDFLNSDARDHLGRGRHRDRLEEAAWLRAFLRRLQIGRVDATRPPVRTALRRLRGLLRELVEVLVRGESLSDRHVARLNRYLAAGPVRSRLRRGDESFRLELAPTARGVDAALFVLAASFAEFLARGDVSRLRTCENPDCGWVFYDSTRSRTRRWCAENCGNLMKVRRFRKQKKGRPARAARPRARSDPPE